MKRLIRFVRKVIDLFDSDPGFKSLMLDGQTGTIEDYLVASPEDEQRFWHFVTSGRQKIGTCFTKVNEVLVS